MASENVATEDTVKVTAKVTGKKVEKAVKEVTVVTVDRKILVQAAAAAAAAAV